MLVAPPLSEGISFVLRCRDEERTLGAALASFLRVRVPREVVLVLDRCTDRSGEIAEEAQKTGHTAVRIFRRAIPTSRAGVETLATDRSSLRSLPSAVEEAFARARYRWRFHVAADFVLSDALVSWLDSGALFDLSGPSSPVRVRLPAVTPEDGTRNAESYLSNCLLGFGKVAFWEVPIFAEGAREVSIGHEIEHLSTLGELKAYWTEPPWFDAADDEEARTVRARYARIVERIGPEPVGAARGSNPACDAYYRALLDAEKDLSAAGVRLYS